MLLTLKLISLLPEVSSTFNFIFSLTHTHTHIASGMVLLIAYADIVSSWRIARNYLRADDLHCIVIFRCSSVHLEQCNNLLWMI